MQKFTLDEISPQGLRIEYLEVQSYEMNIYLVYLATADKAGMVYDKQGHPKRFFSAGQIRETFAHCQVDRAVMKHDTPYDEMIGNPPKSADQVALPFSMALPY
ncbi:DUF6482 family protein [Alteromonas sp. ASW11-19]|uniref:DUF6482 family protein n=1 Tax=Alteromonas salexigens TaxID=2982530 RepID=A0ABT2VL91_9ALTE|nr:DUF6482 family protein [Alteromonas salexigens]MCU7553577.1 DUF6482 family protein [Alteromonas salexigens]